MFRHASASVAALLATTSLSCQTQTHGQMIGDVTPTSAVVWTRASAPCLVSVLYGTLPNLANAIESAPQTALAARDQTVRIVLNGLGPATRYYYRLRLSPGAGAGTLGPIGHFDTAAAATTPAALRFAFSGDAQTLSQYDIFAAIAAHQPDFYLSLGDFPYCDGSVTMADYWSVHQTRRDSSFLHQLTQSVPVYAIWDDHEVTNNWDALTDPTLVSNGKRAFRDWFPLADGPAQVFRRFRFGRDAELFLVDTRSYRGFNDELPSPAKPMLGSVQLQWLEQSLLQSTATWKFVATSVPTFYGGTDSWDGYVHEREALLAFLRQSQVHDVVFLAADQHIAAVRELREGLLEVQAGPLAQFLGGNQRWREPEQRWHATQRNFGMVHVDPATSPARLRVTFHDAAGALLHEYVTTATTQNATLRWTSDVPEGGFQLADGPHLTRDEGSTAHRDRLKPGHYRLLCRDLPYGAGAPASLDLDVPPGADVRIAADYEDLADPQVVLFADSFDAPFGAPAGWQIVDLGGNGPSSWLVVDGALTQRSNIGGTGAPNYHGTLALAGSAAWTDVTFVVRYRSFDNDSLGVVFRCQGTGDYYRVRLDNERLTAQLARVQNGTARVLAELPNVAGHTVAWWQQLTVSAIGPHVRVWRDGELLFDVQDGTFASGRIGLYTWADQLVAFDDVIVRAGDSTGRGRPTSFATDFANGQLGPFTIVDSGTTSAPSAWSVGGGVLHQDSNINDDDGTRDGLPKRGTVALAGPVLADQELHVRMRSDDDDAIGAVLRYQDADNHYRFSVDAQRHYRRLVKVVQGQWSTLWEADDDYPSGVWHDLQFSARGDRLRVVFDGRTLCDVRDASLPLGRAGVYCWASTPVQFDDFVVQQPPQPRAITVGINTPGQDVLRICAPASAGRTYLLALSLTREPGIPMAALQPNDPRTWELTNDGIFQLSLLPSPLLVQFLGTLDADGEATATLLFPPFVTAMLGGLPLFAGGLTFDHQTGVYGELLPTVPVTVR